MEPLLGVVLESEKEEDYSSSCSNSASNSDSEQKMCENEDINSKNPLNFSNISKLEPLKTEKPISFETKEEINPNSMERSSTTQNDSNLILPKSFPCLWQGCNSVLSTRTGLATHASDHLKIHFKSESAKKQKLQVVCRWNNCNQWFENILTLAKHLAQENHIGQTPYIPKEPTLTATDGDLKHKKRFPCNICQKTFSSSSNLKVHEKLHDPNRQRFACAKSPCKRSYSTEADLKIHMRSHRGEFAYKCSYPSCTEMFVRASQLYAHERVHDNIAVLKCGLCGKRFRMKAELAQHEQTHLVADAKIFLDSFSSNSTAEVKNDNQNTTITGSDGGDMIYHNNISNVNVNSDYDSKLNNDSGVHHIGRNNRAGNISHIINHEAPVSLPSNANGSFSLLSDVNNLSILQKALTIQQSQPQSQSQSQYQHQYQLDNKLDVNQNLQNFLESRESPFKSIGERSAINPSLLTTENI